MICKDALMKKAHVVSPDMSVDEALKALSRAGVFYAPVVDGESVVVGIFSASRLLESALPVSMDIGGVNVPIHASTGMTKRLSKYRAGRVSDVMQRPFRALYPDTPIETAILMLRETGEPVTVVEKETSVFSGVVTDESVLSALAS